MLQYSFWILGIEAYYFSWFDSFWFLNLWEGVRITTLTVPEKRFFMLSFRNLILVQKKLRYKIQIMGGGGGGGGYIWHFYQIWYFYKIWHFCQNWLLSNFTYISNYILTQLSFSNLTFLSKSVDFLVKYITLSNWYFYQKLIKVSKTPFSVPVKCNFAPKITISRGFNCQ